MKRIVAQCLHLLSLVTLAVAWNATAADVTITDADVGANNTWYKTNTYILDGFVFVETNEVLTIEAGTVIKGQPGSGADASALIVARGGQIFANGTAAEPIIFTAEADDVADPGDFGPTDRGLWGGLIILGDATINSPVASGTPIFDNIEGIPVTESRGLYGGSDDADNSGVVRYVSIRHGGTLIGANNEINGLTLGAVGSGTTIEFIEVYANLDDGVEFFGGTVNTRNLAVSFCGDDSYDYDQGWRGKGQFWFTIQDADGDAAGEHDGDIDDFTKTPLSDPTIFNATYIGAGADANGNRGLRIRENAAGDYKNSIFTEFNDAIVVDDTSTNQVNNGNMDFRENIWGPFGAGSTAATIANANAQIFFTDASRSNIIANPMLTGVSRNPDGVLDPRPAAGSPALTTSLLPPADGFFDQVDYKGAFGNALWLRGWTILDQSGFLAAPPSGIVEVTDADIVGDTIFTANNTYVLSGFVFVETNETLTIEAGTVIKGKPGSGANASALVVARGGKIYALGTPNAPIIFTAEADDTADPFDFSPTDRGLWGGLLVLGNSTVNSPVASGTPVFDNIEGIPVTEPRGIYGGSNEADSSGVIRYVSIRHGGSLIGANNEINGLTLGAVGSGTIVEFVEVYANLDDGVEFFGGTVNTRNLAVSFCGDDSYDYDQGFRGNGQFWFTLQDQDGDAGGEHDGDIDDFTKTPLSDPTIFNATYIGAGADANGNRGLRIRENAAGDYVNSIFTEFNDAIVIDNTSTNQLNNGNMGIRENIWGPFGAGSTAATIANGNAQILFTDGSRNNSIDDPLLTGIDRGAMGGLDPRPTAASPAWTVNELPPDDGFFQAAAYKGAFGHDLWLKPWTILAQTGFLPGNDNTITVTDADIGANTIWHSTNTYVLDGFVFVETNEVLTIQPGTVIKGQPGSGADASALIVARGGKIFAEGTANSPIIFTAEADDVSDPGDFGPSDRGLWGGLIVLGNSTLNSPVASGTPIFDNIEGIPVTESRGLYGGSDEADDSGVIRYVSIRHGGTLIGANNEINGLTLGAVGSGTTIEFVEVFANLDDGVEYFGGTPNVRYLSATYCGDDSYDYDQGYRGKGQFWFTIQDADADAGGEHDGDIDDFTKLPLSNPLIHNATYIGAGADANGNRGLRIRENAAGQYVNSIFTEFNDAVVIDNTSTNQVAAGTLNLHDNIWGPFGAGSTPATIANANAQIFFTDGSRNNTIEDPLLNAVSRIPDGLLDPRPSAASPAWSVSTMAPADGFFAQVDYKGAFGSVNWLADWSILAQQGLLSNAGAGTPGDEPTSVVLGPILSIVQNGGNVEISFATEAGQSYQLQSTSTLGVAMTDDGAPVAGTGGVVTLSRAIGSAEFYQVVLP